SGRPYSGISDERGEFRSTNLTPGTYRVEAQLAGFTNSVIPSLELLAGRTANLSFTLRVASRQEDVTVTGDVPLLISQTQDVGGNIDPRQMQLVPILGRNWLELSMLVKGVTANDVGGNRPGVARDNEFQLTLDGQQITQGLAGAAAFGQPRL